MASSTEEVSAPDLSAESRRNENDHFGVFKDFDFLEYESESVEVSYYFIKVLVYYLIERKRFIRYNIIFYKKNITMYLHLN